MDSGDEPATTLPLAARAINEADRRWSTITGRTPNLDVDKLLGRAKQQALLEDFGRGTFREGLDRLVDALNSQANLTAIGRRSSEGHIVSLLKKRLRMRDWAKKNPQIEHERITAPLVIVGMPRTGTTLLSNLLDQDPMNRSLLSWEAGAIAPPPRLTDHREDPRIAEAVASAALLDKIAPEVKAKHPMQATAPTECVELLGAEFASVHFETQASIPAYGEWWQECDMTDAYGQHRMALQILQEAIPTTRWSLKSPAHLWHLDALFAAYPDARVVWTHRDPRWVIPSVASLVSSFVGIGTEAMGEAAVARDWMERISVGVARATAFRADLADDNVFDLPYVELVDDAVSSVERIYQHFGLELSDLGRWRIEAYLNENPKGRHGKHTYSAEQFGLSATVIGERFADYTATYEVPTERAF